jgi:hypothetical protein
VNDFKLTRFNLITKIIFENFNKSFIFLRGNEISVKNDNFKDFTVDLKDHDIAILHYFENVIKPFVILNGQRIKVPVIYGSPERWKSVQKDGFYRDKNSKILVPLIMFKKEGIEKNRNLGNKLDANNPTQFQLFETKYTRENQYDNFSVLNNRIPTKQLTAVIIPDYVTITYSCIIFTDYVEQMDKLVESVNFASDSYWGDPQRFQFKTKIDSFSPSIEINQGEDRAIKTNFNIILNGYLIPETINKDLVNIKQIYSKSRIIFDSEISTNNL